MHYKYVWRGLEEMFEFAHLHKMALSFAGSHFCGDNTAACSGVSFMPRGSAPIIPRGSAFRICLWQIHGSRRRAGARGLSCAEGRYCGDTRLQGKRFPFSTPVSCADSPFQGHAACAFVSGRWLRCFNFLAEVSLTLRHGG